MVTAGEPSPEALQHPEARMGHERQGWEGQGELGLPAWDRRKRGGSSIMRGTWKFSWKGSQSVSAGFGRAVRENHSF